VDKIRRLNFIPDIKCYNNLNYLLVAWNKKPILYYSFLQENFIQYEHVLRNFLKSDFIQCKIVKGLFLKYLPVIYKVKRNFKNS